MLAFRHTDRRLPFLWEGEGQPGARWNAPGGGPAQCFADTPEGAWAEFLRHEEITAKEDIATITRALWAVDLPNRGYAEPDLPSATLVGGPETYAACRAEAGRLFGAGAAGLRAPAAALLPGAASGWRVAGGLRRGPARDGLTFVLFSARADLVGWRAAIGRPAADLVTRVRYIR